MSYERVRSVVDASGLWRGSRQKTHGFHLSPAVYTVTAERKQELTEIARALYQCQQGLCRIAAIVFNPELAKSRTLRAMAQALGSGVSRIHAPLQGLKPGNVPTICKVDFMESESGELAIAEIDGHNKHGLGYSALAARIRDELYPGVDAFPGVVDRICREARRRGGALTMLYADKERFYIPEMEVLVESCRAQDVAVRLVAESQVLSPQCTSGVDLADLPSLFVDFPAMDRNVEAARQLAQLYLDGRVNFLIPPKPFLGSKAALALLRNDVCDPVLEAVLLSQISRGVLALLRRYIPPTYLISKQTTDQEVAEFMGNGSSWVLKQNIACGMKGTLFQDDPAFEAELAAARRTKYGFVLQQAVENRAFRYSYYPDGEEQEADWLQRVTIHFYRDSVADAIVTARQDRSVHGAPDCIQLPAVISG